MLNNILIVTYNFPPIGGSGIQRIQKFIKYLPRFGWKPIVLTVTEDEKVYRIKGIVFRDPLFTGNRERTEKICEMIKKGEGKREEWMF